MARENGEFVYTVSLHGDGTVSTPRVVLPRARTYFAAAGNRHFSRSCRETTWASKPHLQIGIPVPERAANGLRITP
jgi:hypothetical protein